MKNRYMTPVQSFAFGGIANPVQRAMLRGSDKSYLEARQRELDEFESQRQTYNTALQDWQSNVYQPYQQQVTDYNTAAQQYNTEVFNPYQTQYDAYMKAVEAYNAGPRTTDYAGPAAPSLSRPFEMQAPTAPTDFSMSAPVLPFKEEDVQKFQQEAAGRARTDAAGRALAIDVVSNPDQFNFGSMSVANRFMAKGGPVEKTAREQLDDMSAPRDDAAITRMLAEMQSNGGMDRDAVRAAVSSVAQAGRGGDELLAHLSPESRQVLMRMGGSGTVNPSTGLPEFKGGILGSISRALGLSSRDKPAAEAQPVAVQAAPSETPIPAAVDLAKVANTPSMGSTGIGVTGAALPAAAAPKAPSVSALTNAAAPAAPAAPTLTPEIARDLMLRSMTTGVPTSEFNKYGGYDAVSAVYNSSGGTYDLKNVPKDTLTSLAHTVAQTGVGNLSILKQAGVPLTQAGYENMIKNGVDPATAASYLKQFGAVTTLPIQGAIARWNTPTNFAGVNLTGVSGYSGVNPTDYSSILSSRPVGWDGTTPRTTGATGQPTSGTTVPGPGSETPLSPTIVPSFMDYTNRGVGAIGDVGGIRIQGPSMPVFGNERLSGGAATNPNSYFAQTPQTSTGLAPGSAAIGPAEMPLYGAKNTMAAIGANPNLSPTMLGGQQNAGMYTDRLGNRIFSPGMPPLRPPGFAKGGGVDVNALLAQNAETLLDEEPEEVINTNPVGTAQQMLADLAGTERASPTRMSVKRTKTATGGGATADKSMRMGTESLAKGDLGAMKETAAPKGAPESARSQMEELARVYQLRMTAARNKARGLSADTFGAPTLEGATLTKNTLAKKRFAKGGEAKKPEGDAAPKVTGVNKVLDFIAQRLPADVFPTSGRTLLETVQGAKTPITEKNFSPEEMDVMRELAALKGGDKGSINYADYVSLAKEMNKKGKVPASMSPSLFSMADPMGNVQTTLGQFRYMKDPQGNLQVVDKYDFNPPNPNAMQEARTGDYGAFGPYGLIRDYAGEKVPPGAGREVRVNLGPVKKRAKGSPEEGEVSQEELDAASRPAFVTPKSGKGRKSSTKAGDLEAAALQGISETPYNLLGAPVDLATMAMRPFGYNVEAPMLGSEDLKRRATKAGIRQEPPKEGTAARALFNLAEIGSSAVNPAAPVRAGMKAAKAVGDKATDVAKDFQEYNRQLTVPGASYVSRSPGGYFPTSRSTEGGILSNLDKAFDPVLKEIRDIDDPEKRQALTMLFNQKAKDFYTKQAGSVDDPLRRDILSGALKFERSTPMGDTFPQALQKGVAQGDLEALRLLEKQYDNMLGLQSVVPRRVGTDEVEGVMQSQIMANIQANLDKIPDAQLLAYAGRKPGQGPTGVADVAGQIRQKIKDNPTLFSTVLEPRIAETLFVSSRNVSDSDMARYPSLYGSPAVEAMVTPGGRQPDYGEAVDAGYFLPDMEKAIEKGQPIQDINTASMRMLGLSPEQMLRQASQMDPDELNQMGFPDFLKKAYANTQQVDRFERSIPLVKKAVEAGKVPPADIMTYGVKDFLPTGGDFRWVKVVKPDGVRAIAAGMNNSVASYAKSTTYGSLNKGRAALDSGEAEVYSLYDKNNVPHVTVEYLTAKPGVPDEKKNTIAQLTGNGPLTANAVPENYAPQIVDLLNNLRPSSMPPSIKKLLEKTGQKEFLTEEALAPLYFGVPIQALR